MAKLDRTNISNGWYQIRTAAEAAFGLEQVRDSNVISAGGTYPAVVLHTGKSTLVPRNFTRSALESSLMTRLGLGTAETEQYKLYFRVDRLNSNIPLPPSFRNIVFPEGYPISQGQGGSVEVDGQGNAVPTSISARDYNTSSPLAEAYEEEMLISCHPSLMMTMDPSNPDSNPGKLNPGDVIEIRFVNNSFSSAVFEKVVTRGLNIIKPILQLGSPIDLFDGETFEISDLPTPTPFEPTPPSDIKKLADSYDEDDSIPIKSQHFKYGIERAHPEMIPYIKAFIYKSWKELKVIIQINSTYRSPMEQQELIEEWIAGGRQGVQPAAPGTSYHEVGLALDFQPYLPPDYKVVLGKAAKGASEEEIEINKKDWIASKVPALGESLNLRWGGHFSGNYDPVHFDLGNVFSNDQKKNLLAKAASAGIEPVLLEIV